MDERKTEVTWIPLSQKEKLETASFSKKKGENTIKGDKDFSIDINGLQILQKHAVSFDIWKSTFEIQPNIKIDLMCFCETTYNIY